MHSVNGNEPDWNDLVQRAKKKDLQARAQLLRRFLSVLEQSLEASQQAPTCSQTGEIAEGADESEVQRSQILRLLTMWGLPGDAFSVEQAEDICQRTFDTILSGFKKDKGPFNSWMAVEAYRVEDALLAQLSLGEGVYAQEAMQKLFVRCGKLLFPPLEELSNAEKEQLRGGIWPTVLREFDYRKRRTLRSYLGDRCLSLQTDGPLEPWSTRLRKHYHEELHTAVDSTGLAADEIDLLISSLWPRLLADFAGSKEGRFYNWVRNTGSARVGEAIIVQKFRRHGDEASLGRLLESYRPVLLGEVNRILVKTRYSQTGLDEDFFQEAVKEFFERIERYDHSRPLKPYLLTIAKRRVFDYLRNKERKKEDPVEEDSKESEGPEPLSWKRVAELALRRMGRSDHLVWRLTCEAFLEKLLLDVFVNKDLPVHQLLAWSFNRLLAQENETKDSAKPQEFVVRFSLEDLSTVDEAFDLEVGRLSDCPLVAKIIAELTDKLGLEPDTPRPCEELYDEALNALHEADRKGNLSQTDFPVGWESFATDWLAGMVERKHNRDASVCLAKLLTPENEIDELTSWAAQSCARRLSEAKPQELLAFGYLSVLRWEPGDVLAEWKDRTLADMTIGFARICLKELGNKAYARCFERLRERLGYTLVDTILNPQTLRSLPWLLSGDGGGRITGSTRFFEYYRPFSERKSPLDPTDDLRSWIHSIVRLYKGCRNILWK